MLERSNRPTSEIYSYSSVTPPFLQATFDYDVRSASDKIASMDDHGVDYAVLTPGINVSLPTVQHSQTAVALGDAYNNWLVDEVLGKSDRLKGTLVVSHQNPRKFADQIDDYGSEDHVVGVQFPPSGPLPPLGDDYYDPIYEAAKKQGLPIAMHAGNADGINHFPALRKWNETFAESHALTFPFAHMWQLTTMLYRGVPERFPDLEFVLQESGIGWLPYMMWRLDDHYMEMSQELPQVQRRPSAYVREKFSIATQPLGLAEHPEYIGWTIQMIGADNVVFASDHPHPDFDAPADVVRQLRAALDDDQVRQIMGANARRVFGF